MFNTVPNHVVVAFRPAGEEVWGTYIDGEGQKCGVVAKNQSELIRRVRGDMHKPVQLIEMKKPAFVR